MGRMKVISFSVLILILISLSATLCLAGTTKFFDLYEIKDADITRQELMRSFEAFRFRFNGTLCRIGIDEIKSEEVKFFFTASDVYIGEKFTLQAFSRKSFDLDKDSKVDFSISLDNVTKSSTRERAIVTFSTSGLLEDLYVETDDDMPDNNTTEIIMPDNKAPKQLDKVVEKEEENLTDDFSLLQDNDEDYKKPISSAKFTLVMWFLVLLLILFIVLVLFAIYKKRHHYLE